MKILETEIIIDSNIEHVWDVLTDFEKYPEWNPFLTQVKGALKPLETLTVTAHPSSSVARTFFPQMVSVEDGVEFSWLGQFHYPKLLDGHHIFRLEKIDENRTRFVHNENFKGFLLFAHLLLRWKHTELGFNEMNEALKRRCEEQAKQVEGVAA